MIIPHEGCFFCRTQADGKETEGWNGNYYFYHCKKCGAIKLSEDAVDVIHMQHFSKEDLDKLRIILRNASFLRNEKPTETPLSENDLKMLINLYRPLDPRVELE